MEGQAREDILPQDESQVGVWELETELAHKSFGEGLECFLFLKRSGANDRFCGKKNKRFCEVTVDLLFVEKSVLAEEF